MNNNQNNYIQRLPIEIILNSKQGTNISLLDGHKFYDLESEIVARKDEQILFYLKKCFIPFSFYTLSESQKNNKLDIKETQQNGTTNTYSVTIPSGNYNINELLSEIVNLLESNSTFGFKYSITFNKTTAKVSFLLLSGTNALKTEILFGTGVNKSNSCRRLLGFNETDILFTLSSLSISNNIVDLSDGLDSIHIKSNLVGDNIRSTNDSGELLLIPVNLSPFSILYFDDITPFKHKITQSAIKQIEMRLADSNGNVVDFNGIPYTLICQIEFIYNPNSTLTFQNRNLENIETKESRLNIFNNIMNNLENDKVDLNEKQKSEKK